MPVPVCLPHGAQRPSPCPRVGDPEMLSRLRARWRMLQAGTRLDLFEACALLGTDPSRNFARFLDALLRSFAQALGRPPVVFRPGAPELSFDERWLLSLLEALGRDDTDSATFLLRSRLPRHARRSFGFLAAGLVREARKPDPLQMMAG